MQLVVDYVFATFLGIDGEKEGLEVTDGRGREERERVLALFDVLENRAY